MKQIKLTTGEYLLVEVPENAKNFTIVESHSYFKSPRVEHSIGGIDLPNDEQWGIIGRASEFSESDIEKIIPTISKHHVKQHLNQQPQYDTFWIVVDGKRMFFDTKKQAFEWAQRDELLSLIKSHSMNPSTTLVIKKIK